MPFLLPLLEQIGKEKERYFDELRPFSQQWTKHTSSSRHSNGWIGVFTTPSRLLWIIYGSAHSKYHRFRRYQSTFALGTNGIRIQIYRRCCGQGKALSVSFKLHHESSWSPGICFTSRYPHILGRPQRTKPSGKIYAWHTQAGYDAKLWLLLYPTSYKRYASKV